MAKITVKTIMQMKAKEKITALTCYSYFNAKVFDEIGIDILLVGDSVGNVVLGYPSTIPVTVDDIVYHSRAVSRGAKNSLIVADMPFMSYQSSNEIAIKNAGLLVKEGRASAVKLEGGVAVKDRVKAIVDMGIPVMGHLGLLPQSVNKMGGYFVQGKTEKEVSDLISSAVALEEQGAFAIVLECVPEEVAKKITQEIKIPTIGIGSGRFCDGQILVFEDMVGLTVDKNKKFVKIYDNIGQRIKDAAINYKEDVKTKKFPSKENILA